MVTAAFTIGTGTSAARAALSAALGASTARTIAIVQGDGRAPRAQPWVLSIADRDGRAAAAVAGPGARVGIDLDRDEAIPASAERYFLTAEERRGAGRLPTIALWILKEAAWKALECDDATPFKALRLGFGSGRLRAIQLGDALYPARARLFRPWPGYLAAVVRATGSPP